VKSGRGISTICTYERRREDEFWGLLSLPPPLRMLLLLHLPFLLILPVVILISRRKISTVLFAHKFNTRLLGRNLCHFLLKRDESDEAEGEHVKPCCRENNESGDKDLL
jgi:hypothetical protein